MLQSALTLKYWNASAACLPVALTQRLLKILSGTNGLPEMLHSAREKSRWASYSLKIKKLLGDTWESLSLLLADFVTFNPVIFRSIQSLWIPIFPFLQHVNCLNCVCWYSLCKNSYCASLLQKKKKTNLNSSPPPSKQTNKETNGMKIKLN